MHQDILLLLWVFNIFNILGMCIYELLLFHLDVHAYIKFKL